MKQLFPIACLLLSLQGFSQYHKIDSLLFLIVEQSPDTMKLRVYHELSKAYSYINLDTCLYYGELSYQIATDNNLPKDQVKALMNIGYAQFDLGDVSKSPEYFERAFEIANSLQDTFLLATVSNGLGLIHWKLDQNEIAIKHLQNAYTWAQKSDNEHIYQCALNNLGVLNYSIGRDAEAIK
ncbi:MAG TPA: tetratricopeptide repeat protein, partial [Phaeodactylibacter sp.]|nr:tetratricopeptide repeat protein [Phaeodactylibacter sp.]